MHEEPYAVVSITIPDAKHPAILQSPNCKGVLRLHFVDTAHHRSTSVGTFSRQMAAQIAEFVEGHISGGSMLLVINCDAGISRSAGVAAALSKFYNGEDAFLRQHFEPNHIVQELLEDVLRMK